MKTVKKLGLIAAALVIGLSLAAGFMSGTGLAGRGNALSSLEPSGGSVIINEIRIDQPGTDNDEYFELNGNPSSSLDGLTYLVIGDGTGGSGVLEAVVDLTGQTIPADGIFLAAESTFSLPGTPDLVTSLNFENSDNVTHLLVTGFSGSNGDDLDTNDDGVLDVTPWSAVLDLVALIVEDNPPASTEYHYGPPTVGPDGSFVPGHVYFCNSSWAIGAFDPNGGQDSPGIENDCPTDLSISKTAPEQVAPGELFTYTINVQNSLGLTLNGVVITDVVPAGSTFAYAQDSGTEIGGVVSWNLGTLADQGNASVRFAVTATNVIPSIILNDNFAIGASNYMTTTFGDSVGTLVYGTIGPACGDPAIYIHAIQGSGDASPIEGAAIAIEGVVVGAYPTGGIDGYFVQEEDGDADADPMTSEGIFVYDSASVQINDVVRVFGTVNEFNGLTELNQVTNVIICNSGASVTPATVTLPIAALDHWERYEGMLLNFPHPLYVTELFTLGRYGEVSLSVDERVYIPTQITDPGDNANAQAVLNDRSRIQLNDAQTGQNPDPIIYPSPELSATNTLRGGDMVADLTGVLNYAFGAYLLEPVGPITFTHSNPRPSIPEPLSGTLKVASFNVLNYFSTIDDGVNDICGPLQDQECRGADSAEEFTRQRDKIISALLALDADIVGLTEIENHATDAALDDLVNGLNDIAGTGTYAKIDTGPIGSDAIKVAFIYQPATVTPEGNFAVLDDSFDTNYHDDYNRPALAQTFKEIATDESLTVIVNHFKSKGSDCDALGDPDTGDGQGNCNLTRLAAAEVMLDWLAADPTSSNDPDFLIIGDLNSYAMEDPIAALKDGGFTDLYNTLSDAYSYVFDGEWGTLDYALANDPLASQVSGVTAWHINADEPIVLDYNEEFKSAHHVISLYSDDAYRASDHDPVIVTFDLESTQTIYLPLISGSAATSHAPAQSPSIPFAAPAVLIAVIGMGALTLRRKR